MTVLAACATSAAAALQPEEIAVVAARGNRGSEELAAYYAKVRGIPEENICLVDMPTSEVCQREHWTWAVRPEIRKWLDEHDPDRKLRCLVTMWGVPLTIGPADADAAREKYREFLAGDRRERIKLLNRVAVELDSIAEDIFVSEPIEPREGDETPSPSQTELETIRAKVERHLQSAQARVVKLQGDRRLKASMQLQQLAMLGGGARVVLQGMEKQLATRPDDELRSQFDMLRGRSAGLMEMQALVDQVPLGYYHDALVLAALERNNGLLGTIEWLDNQLQIVDKNETGASFDSELSLVLWPDDYELLRWQPNYLRAGYEASQWGKVFPTLMVARIDGPTLALAKGLVDAAVKVETQGLHGKAYFDARGMGRLDQPNQSPGSYADYDRALLVAAKNLRDATTIDVVLNESPELFQAGACPEAALYCGWYSLAKYVDAFDWQPGAVAYHLASGEAATLRDRGSQVWCKRMIEDGVAVTIGPVYEPYLIAFPRPDQFFSLLLQGELTLVECYYRTLPFNSWMMTLIGDPLYRPFKNLNVVRTAANQNEGSAAPAEP